MKFFIRMRVLLHPYVLEYIFLFFLIQLYTYIELLNISSTGYNFLTTWIALRSKSFIHTKVLFWFIRILAIFIIYHTISVSKIEMGTLFLILISLFLFFFLCRGKRIQFDLSIFFFYLHLTNNDDRVFV